MLQLKKRGGFDLNTTAIVLTVISAVLALLFIVVRVWKGGLVALLIKTLASMGFVITGLIGVVVSDLPNTVPLALIVIGLLFGMVGDILLDLKVIYDNDKIHLNSGMFSFTLGHICYFSALSILALETLDSLLVPILISIGSAVVLTIATMYSGKLIKLDFGKFFYQVAGYSFALTFMTVYTLVLAIMSAGLWLTFVALILFLVSDLVLSIQYFGDKITDKLLITINHGLYYTAQIILAVVVFVV